MPCVVDRLLPPIGKPLTATRDETSGSLPRGPAGAAWRRRSRPPKSARPGRSPARSRRPWPRPGRPPARLHVDLLGVRTRWAMVRIRLPSMTTPVPLTSIGFCLVHGRTGLGSRIWLNTLTTESAEPPACASASRSVKTTAEAPASHREMLFMILASSRRTDFETHAFPVLIRTEDQDLTIAPRNHAGRVSSRR